MKDRRLLLYLLLNVIVSACVTGGVLFAYEQYRTMSIGPAPEQVVASAPTANPAARVEITAVVGAGMLGTERVVLRNGGSAAAPLSGWRLQDDAGNIFFFPEITIHPEGTLQIHTGPGDNTVIDLYWGLSQPAWTSGKTISLLDAAGTVQAQYQVP